MSSKAFISIGIDNGVSGTIGVVYGSGERPLFAKVPTFSSLNYTKKKRNVTRIDTNKLRRFILKACSKESGDIFFTLENPMINAGRFQATVSASRAYEATLIAIERVAKILAKEDRMVGVRYITSKDWQKVFFSGKVKGPELKKISAQRGCELFPSCVEAIAKHKDADGLFIAEWSARQRRNSK
jgi:hypothetical protein